MKKYKKGLVVLSGGQDSITCLGVAIDECETVIAISFDYGQRHKTELTCAKQVSDMLGINHLIVEIPMLAAIVTSALTGTGDVSDPHPNNPKLPASFVPARNALFIVLSHAHAAEKDCEVVYLGVCETDYSGYPDCREMFVCSMFDTMNIGYDTHIRCITPLMHLNKAQTFKLADDVGFLDVVLEQSHTCYEGDRSKRFEWGYGCGECPACKLRAKGWADYLELETFKLETDVSSN
jgi:7-cyano-7-deazaguanine synthase